MVGPTVVPSGDIPPEEEIRARERELAPKPEPVEPPEPEKPPEPSKAQVAYDEWLETATEEEKRSPLAGQKFQEWFRGASEQEIEDWKRETGVPTDLGDIQAGVPAGVVFAEAVRKVRELPEAEAEAFVKDAPPQLKAAYAEIVAEREAAAAFVPTFAPTGDIVPEEEIRKREREMAPKPEPVEPPEPEVPPEPSKAQVAYDEWLETATEEEKRSPLAGQKFQEWFKGASEQEIEDWKRETGIPAPGEIGDIQAGVPLGAVSAMFRRKIAQLSEAEAEEFVEKAPPELRKLYVEVMAEREVALEEGIELPDLVDIEPDVKGGQTATIEGEVYYLPGSTMYEAGWRRQSDYLKYKVKPRQDVIAVTSIEGKELLIPIDQVRHFLKLEDTEQFEAAVELGIVPEGSQYVPPLKDVPLTSLERTAKLYGLTAEQLAAASGVTEEHWGLISPSTISILKSRQDTLTRLEQFKNEAGEVDIGKAFEAGVSRANLVELYGEAIVDSMLASTLQRAFMVEGSKRVDLSKLTFSQSAQLVGKSDKQVFDLLMEWGMIPEGSQFIPGISPEEAAEIRKLAVELPSDVMGRVARIRARSWSYWTPGAIKKHKELVIGRTRWAEAANDLIEHGAAMGVGAGLIDPLQYAVDTPEQEAFWTLVNFGFSKTDVDKILADAKTIQDMRKAYVQPGKGELWLSKTDYAALPQRLQRVYVREGMDGVQSLSASVSRDIEEYMVLGAVIDPRGKIVDQKNYDIAKFLREQGEENEWKLRLHGFKDADIKEAKEYNNLPWVKESPFEAWWKKCKATGDLPEGALPTDILWKEAPDRPWTHALWLPAMGGALPHDPEISDWVWKHWDLYKEGLLLDKQGYRRAFLHWRGPAGTKGFRSFGFDPQKQVSASQFPKPEMSFGQYMVNFVGVREEDVPFKDKRELESLSALQYARLYHYDRWVESSDISTSSFIMVPARLMHPEIEKLSGLEWAIGSAQIVTLGLGAAPAGVVRGVLAAMAGGVFLGATLKEWDKLTPAEQSIGLGVGLLLMVPGAVSVARSIRRGVKVTIPTSKGKVTFWRGVSAGGRPLFGVSAGRLTVGRVGVTYPAGIAKVVKQGWQPVTKLEASLAGTKKALTQMGFSDAEITKLLKTVRSTKGFAGKPSPYIPKVVDLGQLEMKALSPKGFEVVLRHVMLSGGKIKLFYGSASMKLQLAPKLARLRKIADIDIQADMTMKQAIAWTKRVANDLKAVEGSGNVRISGRHKVLIETKDAQGRWHHAVDFHAAEQVPGYAVSAEGAYGVEFAESPVRIKVPGYGEMRWMTLSETGKRKMASILQWQKGKFTPEAHRVKDISDYYMILRTFRGMDIADEWAQMWGYTPDELLGVQSTNPLVGFGWEFVASPQVVGIRGLPAVTLMVPRHLMVSLAARISPSRVASFATRVSKPVGIIPSASVLRQIKASMATSPVSPYEASRGFMQSVGIPSISPRLSPKSSVPSPVPSPATRASVRVSAVSPGRKPETVSPSPAEVVGERPSPGEIPEGEIPSPEIPSPVKPSPGEIPSPGVPSPATRASVRVSAVSPGRKPETVSPSPAEVVGERPSPGEIPEGEIPSPEIPSPVKPSPGEIPSPGVPSPFVPKVGEKPSPHLPAPVSPRVSGVKEKPKKPIFLPGIPDKVRKRIRESPGVITWRQGEVTKGGVRVPNWWVLMPPYKSRADLVLLHEKPPGATEVTGPKSAYRTIQMVTGRPPARVITIDMGIVDIHINRPSRRPGRKGAIKFKRDRRRRTVSDISVSGVR